MKQRQTELDILRFLATLAVITIHLGRNPYLSTMWKNTTYSVSIVPLVWSVPVFIMISGRFLLDPQKEVSPHMILRKYIPRIVSAFAVWSAVYVVYDTITGKYNGLNILGLLTQWINGPVHFWYLYMLAGLYLLTPVLRHVVQNNRTCAYFLIVFFVYNLVTQYLVFLPKVGAIIENTVSRLGLDLFSGYVGCYVLGYFIYRNHEKITSRWEAVIYTVGILLFALTCILESIISPELQNSNFVKQYQKPNVILFSAAIFIFFVKRVARISFSIRTQSFFSKTTQCSFGVYLIHALVIDLLSWIPLPENFPLPVFLTATMAGLIFLCSFILTALLQKNPIFRKVIS